MEFQNYGAYVAAFPDKNYDDWKAYMTAETAKENAARLSEFHAANAALAAEGEAANAQILLDNAQNQELFNNLDSGAFDAYTGLRGWDNAFAQDNALDDTELNSILENYISWNGTDSTDALSQKINNQYLTDINGQQYVDKNIQNYYNELLTNLSGKNIPYANTFADYIDHANTTSGMRMFSENPNTDYLESSRNVNPYLGIGQNGGGSGYTYIPYEMATDFVSQQGDGSYIDTHLIPDGLFQQLLLGNDMPAYYLPEELRTNYDISAFTGIDDPYYGYLFPVKQNESQEPEYNPTDIHGYALPENQADNERAANVLKDSKWLPSDLTSWRAGETVPGADMVMTGGTSGKKDYDYSQLAYDLETDTSSSARTWKDDDRLIRGWFGDEVLGNPLVNGLLSIFPVTAPYMAAINGVQAASQGNVLGALAGAYGAYTGFTGNSFGAQAADASQLGAQGLSSSQISDILGYSNAGGTGVFNDLVANYGSVAGDVVGGLSGVFDSAGMTGAGADYLANNVINGAAGGALTGLGYGDPLQGALFGGVAPIVGAGVSNALSEILPTGTGSSLGNAALGGASGGLTNALTNTILGNDADIGASMLSGAIGGFTRNAIGQVWNAAKGLFEDDEATAALAQTGPRQSPVVTGNGILETLPEDYAFDFATGDVGSMLPISGSDFEASPAIINDINSINTDWGNYDVSWNFIDDVINDSGYVPQQGTLTDAELYNLQFTDPFAYDKYVFGDTEWGTEANAFDNNLDYGSFDGTTANPILGANIDFALQDLINGGNTNTSTIDGYLGVPLTDPNPGVPPVDPNPVNIDFALQDLINGGNTNTSTIDDYLGTGFIPPPISPNDTPEVPYTAPNEGDTTMFGDTDYSLDGFINSMFPENTFDAYDFSGWDSGLFPNYNTLFGEDSNFWDIDWSQPIDGIDWNAIFNPWDTTPPSDMPLEPVDWSVTNPGTLPWVDSEDYTGTTVDDVITTGGGTTGGTTGGIGGAISGALAGLGANSTLKDILPWLLGGTALAGALTDNKPTTTSSVTTSTPAVPDWYDKAQQTMAGSIAAMPLVSPQYTQPLAAGITQNEQAGVGMADSVTGAWAPQFANAVNQATRTAMTIPETDLTQYMNPYMAEVLAPTLRGVNQNFDASMNKLNDAAASRGSFGGSRNSLLMGLNEENRARALGEETSKGFSNAFNYATDTALKDRAALLSTANSLGSMAGDYQRMLSGDVNQLMSTGAVERGISDNLYTKQYADFLNQLKYPLDAVGAYSGALGSIAPKVYGNTATVTNTGAAPNMWSNLLGMGATGVALYNDIFKQPTNTGVNNAPGSTNYGPVQPTTVGDVGISYTPPNYSLT